MTSLAGKLVLVVEDDAVLAARTSDMLVDGGADVVGPAHGWAEALSLVAREPVDAAVLDLHLADRWTFPLAEAVERSGGAVVFVTGHGVCPRSEIGATPLLRKPFERADLTAALMTAMTPAEPEVVPVGGASGAALSAP